MKDNAKGQRPVATNDSVVAREAARGVPQQDLPAPVLAPCPFCNGGETRIHESHLSPTMKGPGAVISATVRHWCPTPKGQPTGLHVSMYGRDKAAAIAAWNTRAAPKAEALECLTELHALVWGESPGLLNEDSGGDARLDLRIRALLEQEGVAPDSASREAGSHISSPSLLRGDEVPPLRSGRTVELGVRNE